MLNKRNQDLKIKEILSLCILQKIRKCVLETSSLLIAMWRESIRLSQQEQSWGYVSRKLLAWTEGTGTE